MNWAWFILVLQFVLGLACLGYCYCKLKFDPDDWWWLYLCGVVLGMCIIGYAAYKIPDI